MYLVVFTLKCAVLVTLLASPALVAASHTRAPPRKRLLYGAVFTVLLALCADSHRLGQFARLCERGGGAAVPVGSGWSFLLQRRCVPGRIVRAPRGERCESVWGGGTQIRHVQSALARRGLTLTSHPSVMNGTLGAWIASLSHGSGGSLWRSNFGRTWVQNLQTGEERVLASPKEIFHDRTSFAERRAWLVRWVELRPTENVWVRKRAAKVRTEAEMRAYASTPTWARLLMVGARGTMALTWEPFVGEHIKHVDPHLGSVVGLYFQADILSALQGAGARDEPWFRAPVEAAENYHAMMRLRVAHKFTPLMRGPQWCVPMLFYDNFEVFVLDYEATPRVLLALAEATADLCRTMGGRLEIRHGTRKLFLDYGVPRGTCVRPVFEGLRRILGDASIRLHPGKRRVDVSPFVEVAW